MGGGEGGATGGAGGEGGAGGDAGGDGGDGGMAPPPQAQHMVAEEKSASSNWPQYTGFSVYVAQSAEKKSRAAPFVSEHTAGGDGGAIGGAGLSLIHI